MSAEHHRWRQLGWFVSYRARVRSRIVWLLLLGIVLSACQMQATVDIEVSEDGSGTVFVGVSLDDDAAASVPNLRDELRTDDLVEAGWTVSGPASEDDGLVWIRAEKAFGSPAEFEIVMTELSGNRIFRNFRLARDREFAQTIWTVSGTVDWSDGIAAFSDDELTAELLGEPLGYSQQEWEERTGSPVADALRISVSVLLPDDATGNADQLAGGRGTWTIRLDDGAPTRIVLEGTVEDAAPRLWLGAAFTIAGLAAAYVLIKAVGAFARRTGHIREATERARTEIVESPVRPPVQRERKLEMVVLGGTGVVFDPGDGVEGLLVPFVRSTGSQADEEDIASYHRSASLGHFNAAEFWHAVGAVGEPSELDHAYLSRVRTNPGLFDFLDRADERGLRVACITNAILTWSHLLRSRFELTERIEPWIVSSDIGARKPSPAVFEAVRRMSGVPFENCLYIDSSVESLDTARSIGMSTVLFAHQAADAAAATGHPVIRGFSELFRSAQTSGQTTGHAFNRRSDD